MIDPSKAISEPTAPQGRSLAGLAAPRNSPRTTEQLRKLFIGNPMQMEVTRFRRRFVNVTQSPKLNQALSGLVIFSYLMILAIVFAARKDLPLEPIAHLQLILMLLAAVVASHAAIAGERDRRSWDLLQVAPISQYQIVVGKFMGSATLLIGMQLIFLPMMLMTVGGEGGIAHNLLTLAAVEAISISVSLFVSAATIYLSSRMKNANATLVTGIGGLAGVFILVPLLAAIFIPGWMMGSFLAGFHPFYWISRLLEGAARTTMGDQGIHVMILGITMLFPLFAYLFGTGAFLTMTGRRLTRQRSKE